MTADTEAPGGRLLLRAVRSHPAQHYYLHVPPGARGSGTVLVAVHGISRDAREQVLAWRGLARELGWPVIAPLFDARYAPRYQRLGWDGEGRRADELLDAMLLDAAGELGATGARLVLAGYSGGAQFCHRYALAQPSRVRALICGAAGWYTWPDRGRPWPLGCGTEALGPSRRLDLDGFLGVPALVYVGTRDTAPGSALRSEPALDRLQGRDRRTRARRWVHAVGEAAAARGLAPPASYLELPDVEHDFAAAVRAGVVALAGRWLLGGPSGLADAAAESGAFAAAGPVR